MEIELRTLSTNGLVFDDDTMSVSGYVNKTGQPSAILGSGDNQFREIIEPGVFSQALQESDVVDFYDEHDADKVLATTSNGSLNLIEDEIGLSMKANIVSTSWGNDTYELIKSGIITGMSFGMRVLDDEWSMDEDGMPLRKVKAIQLFEVSAVRHPAYPESILEARGITVVNNIKVPKKKKEEVRSVSESTLDTSSLEQKIDNLITVVSDTADRLKDLLAIINESRSTKSTKAEEIRDDTDTDVEQDSEDKKKDVKPNKKSESTDSQKTEVKNEEKKTKEQRSSEEVVEKSENPATDPILEEFRSFLNLDHSE